MFRIDNDKTRYVSMVVNDVKKSMKVTHAMGKMIAAAGRALTMYGEAVQHVTENKGFLQAVEDAATEIGSVFYDQGGNIGRALQEVFNEEELEGIVEEVQENIQEFQAAREEIINLTKDIE